MSTSQASRPRRPAAPLYEARFEHDACGVGFVADAGGRSRERVLPLALAGLAALGHRGAFGADGESSDGAGVSLPLDRSLLRAAGRRCRGGPAGHRVALPAARPAAGATGTCARRGDVRRGRPADRRRGARSPSTLPRSVPRPQPHDRPSHTPSWRVQRAARTTRGRSRTTRSSAAWSSPGVASSRRRGQPAARWPSCPCLPPRPARSSTRAWSSAAAWPSCTQTCAPHCRSATRSSTSATRRTPTPSGGSPSRSGRSPITARSIRCVATAPRSMAGPATPRRARSPRRSSPPARCCRAMRPTRCRSTRPSSC